MDDDPPKNLEELNDLVHEYREITHQTRGYEESDRVQMDVTRRSLLMRNDIEKRLHIDEYDTDREQVKTEAERIRSAYDEWRTKRDELREEYEEKNEPLEEAERQSRYIHPQTRELRYSAKREASKTAHELVYTVTEELGHDLDPAAVYRFCEDQGIEAPEDGYFIQALSNHSTEDVQILPDMSDADVDYVDGIGFDNNKDLVIEGLPELGTGRYGKGARGSYGASLILLDRDDLPSGGGSRIRPGTRRLREGTEVYVRARDDEETADPDDDTVTVVKPYVNHKQALRDEHPSIGSRITGHIEELKDELQHYLTTDDVPPGESVKTGAVDEDAAAADESEDG